MLAMRMPLAGSRALLRGRQAAAVQLGRGPRVVVLRSASAVAGEASTSGGGGPRPSWDIRMLYDGDCPLCMREVNMLKKRDQGKGRIDFVDVASPDYDPAANAGISFEQAMVRIHAIQADGTILTDVEVFRALYEAVGLGWIYAATKNGSVLKAANALYGVWAKYRMEVTGREAMPIILERRRLQDAGKASCRTLPGQGEQGGASAAAACEVQPVAAGKAK